MDYLKYICGNLIVIASALVQMSPAEVVLRSRISWGLAVIVGLLTIAKLVKDLRKK